MTTNPTITWKVWEEIGSPIYRCPEVYPMNQTEWDDFRANPANLFLEEDSLVEGTQFFCEPYSRKVLTVIKSESDCYALSPSGKLIYFLTYDTERSLSGRPNCWKCTGAGNLSAIQKLTLEA